MLNTFTAERKRRGDDPFSPGGKVGLRPDRATIVYAQRAREAWPGVPIVLGGIEASLRRIAHFDYWSDSVRRPILIDAKADLLVFGMGEHPIREVAARLAAGEPISRIRDVRGTAWPLTAREADALLVPRDDISADTLVELETYAEVAPATPEGKAAFARMTKRTLAEMDPCSARPLLQRIDRAGGRAVYLNPPALPLTTEELDALYRLPFQRAVHPTYTESVPALETVRHSLVATRGCFGGCAFCSIAAHEGRRVQSRSPASLEDELERWVKLPWFHGTVSDVGGPTANMYQMGCREPHLAERCRRASCLHPRVCPHLETSHRPLVELLRRLRRLPGVRHVFLASGIRHDLALEGEYGREFIGELARHHVGGHLSLAPEHVAPHVLALMGKPNIGKLERFSNLFDEESRAAGKEQYTNCYFISGHPGCRLEDMVEIALYLKAHRLRPRQVQEFIPTPMSPATAMYHTGLDPRTMKPLHVARGLREKRLQKALLFYWDVRHQAEVREALLEAGRPDLIGARPSCIVRPVASRHPSR